MTDNLPTYPRSHRAKSFHLLPIQCHRKKNCIHHATENRSHFITARQWRVVFLHDVIVLDVRRSLDSELAVRHGRSTRVSDGIS